MTGISAALRDLRNGTSGNRGGKFRWFSRRGRGRYGTAILGAGMIAAMFGTPWLRQGGGPDLLLEAAGWLVFLCGAILRMWAILHIGGRKGHVIMDRGPYRLMRHPLYVGSFLIALSMALFLDSLVLLIAALLTAVAYHLHVIPREEGRLVDRFGTPYLTYCRATPRYVPARRSAAATAEPARVLEVDLAALATECTRAVWWAALPLFAALITWLRVQPWWPHWSPLP
jgi:protein-S-isoprenylcysteine O-methyltransferase Ste14